MIGERQIIEYRKRGLKPAAIFFEFGLERSAPKYLFEEPEQAIAHNLYPVVSIGRDEPAQRLDLRFVTGCGVHLHGKLVDDPLIAIGEKLADSKPEFLIVGGLLDGVLLEFRNNAWRAYVN
jgi:hypothetical protein